MEGLVDDLDAKQVAIVLRELQVCRDPSFEKATKWLGALQEQLSLFKAQRNKDEDPDDEDEPLIAAVAVEDLRYFETLSHLLWWTLCSAVAFFSGDHPQQTAADVFVPGQRNFDDWPGL